MVKRRRFQRIMTPMNARERRKKLKSLSSRFYSIELDLNSKTGIWNPFLAILWQKNQTRFAISQLIKLFTCQRNSNKSISLQNNYKGQMVSDRLPLNRNSLFVGFVLYQDFFEQNCRYHFPILETNNSNNGFENSHI